MGRIERTCPGCGKTSSTFKLVACVSCRTKRRLCEACSITFTGCDAACKKAHREIMKNAFGSKDLTNLSEGRSG